MKRIQARRVTYSILVLFIISLALIAVSKAFNMPVPNRRDGFALNTFVSISLYDGGDDTVLDEAFKLIQYYDTVFSRFNNGELYTLNNEWNINRQKISKPLYECISSALVYCEQTEGLFDITIAPLLDLWAFSDGGRVPEPDETEAALLRVAYQKIELSQDDTDYYIKTNGAKLDLGAAAKGYIADELAVFLKENGVKSAIINLGGNVYALGQKNKDIGFNVGILAPFSGNDLIGSVTVSDKAVVTSGVYQRYFEQEGVLYHHILDPATGCPRETDLYSATVICQSALTADILSTICMLLGLDEGFILIRSLPDTEAVFITNNGDIIKTSGVVLKN